MSHADHVSVSGKVVAKEGKEARRLSRSARGQGGVKSGVGIGAAVQSKIRGIHNSRREGGGGVKSVTRQGPENGDGDTIEVLQVMRPLGLSIGGEGGERETLQLRGGPNTPITTVIRNAPGTFTYRRTRR